MASQITGVSVVCSTVCSSADGKENINAVRHWPLWGDTHRRPMDSLKKGPVSEKMFPFGDVMMHMDGLRCDHSENGVSVWHQAIIWTIAGILSVVPLGTHFSKYQSKLTHSHWRKCNWNVVWKMVATLFCKQCSSDHLTPIWYFQRKLD